MFIVESLKNDSLINYKGFKTGTAHIQYYKKVQ